MAASSHRTVHRATMSEVQPAKSSLVRTMGILWLCVLLPDFHQQLSPIGSWHSPQSTRGALARRPEPGILWAAPSAHGPCLVGQPQAPPPLAVICVEAVRAQEKINAAARAALRAASLQRRHAAVIVKRVRAFLNIHHGQSVTLAT